MAMVEEAPPPPVPCSRLVLQDEIPADRLGEVDKTEALTYEVRRRGFARFFGVGRWAEAGRGRGSGRPRRP